MYVFLLQKYVQDLLEDQGDHISRMLVKEGGHFYVCGDCKMAEEVQHTLKHILTRHANMTEPEADNFIMALMVRKLCKNLLPHCDLISTKRVD